MEQLATFVDSFKQNYIKVLSLGDQRVENWPLMKSPFPTILITLVYIVFCITWKKSSNTLVIVLEFLIPIYNIIVIYLNLFIFKELFIAAKSYSWICEPVDYSSNSKANRVAATLWWYYISKLVELLDSVFIILRGKEKQLSFLHIYHHSTMFCLWWIGVKYVAGGSAVHGAFINSAVHILMYSYYFLTSLRINNIYKWKKYLTSIQICQFVAALILGANAIYIQCNFPLWMQYALIFYMTTFIILFGNFYVVSYYKKTV